MSWRDRTNLFISYRQSYTHHPASRTQFGGSAINAPSNTSSNVAEERRGLMSAAGGQDGDAIIEMGALPPRWADIQDEVIDVLEAIQRSMKRLDPMHAKHVLPGFEDDAVKKREGREIEALTQEITRGFQTCQRHIKRVEAMVRQEKQKDKGISKSEETMARNLQISMATKVGEVSAIFRKKQSSYLKKMRTLGGMSVSLDNALKVNASNPYADPSMLESEADRSFSQSTIQQTQQTTQKRRTNNDSTIAQREKEIEDIAQGIIELANIFTELQTMVIDQGTMLDRIDYNVERMNTDVKAADKELKTATNYQKRSTKRKIMLLLILLVVGMFILLIYLKKWK
jgi:syntaxin 16